MAGQVGENGPGRSENRADDPRCRRKNKNNDRSFKQANEKVSQHSYLGEVRVAKSGTTTTTVKEKQGKNNVRKKKKVTQPRSGPCRRANRAHLFLPPPPLLSNFHHPLNRQHIAYRFTNQFPSAACAIREAYAATLTVVILVEEQPGGD